MHREECKSNTISLFQFFPETTSMFPGIYLLPHPYTSLAWKKFSGKSLNLMTRCMRKFPFTSPLESTTRYFNSTNSDGTAQCFFRTRVNLTIIIHSAGIHLEWSHILKYLIKGFCDASFQLPVHCPPHFQTPIISLRGNIFSNRIPGQPFHQARMSFQSGKNFCSNNKKKLFKAAV